VRRVNPKIKAAKPKNVFEKPLVADFRELFKALAKGIGHTATGKWAELGTDTLEAISSIGLATEPGELAFLLIRRSITLALFELLSDGTSQHLAEASADSNSLLDQLDFSISVGEIYIGSQFLDRPAELPLVKSIQSLFETWLEGLGMNKPAVEAMVGRLPSYFVYALNQEWRRNAKYYRPLAEALNTPFATAGEREWAWTEYAAFLERKTWEGIFDEAFSLRQIYVPLNAFYLEETSRETVSSKITRSGPQQRRVVVSIHEELEQWLQSPNPHDTIRVVSGGPGSGKSSFARILAARISQLGTVKLLFIPLHLIDPSKDLIDGGTVCSR
jgi:hypothetical protein